MFETKTVKILVSCPGDVALEKETIIKRCKDFTDANHGKTNIAFQVIDWRDYVGHHGERGQEQLNQYFNEYEVYIGILWKRFGTPPGSFNNSGTWGGGIFSQDAVPTIDQCEIMNNVL